MKSSDFIFACAYVTFMLIYHFLFHHDFSIKDVIGLAHYAYVMQAFWIHKIFRHYVYILCYSIVSLI